MLGMLDAKQRASLDSMTDYYHQQVDAAAGYLTGPRRGFGRDVADVYRLGAVADPLPGHEQYVGRLVIPYLTQAGTVDLRFRATDDVTQPKYMSRPGAEPHLYNVGALWRDSAVIAVCEGEFDAMVMEHYVGIPAVGVPGAAMWRDRWSRLLADYDRVFVMCDGDEAGRAFGTRLIKQIDSSVMVTLPSEHDVNSLWLRGGKDAVLNAMGL